jgi:hypothetical protein
VNLDLTETQTLLEETVRGYLERELPFDRIRTLEREGGFDEALWKAIVSQGWLGLPFAEALGGGGSLVDTGLLVLALARRAAIVPILEVVAAGRALQHHGGAEGAELVRALLAGEARPVPAILEPGDPCGAPALALEGGRLRGEKVHVDYGHLASHHLVAARAGGEPGLCLVEAAGPGVACEPLRSIGRTERRRTTWRAPTRSPRSCASAARSRPSSAWARWSRRSTRRSATRACASSSGARSRASRPCATTAPTWPSAWRARACSPSRRSPRSTPVPRATRRSRSRRPPPRARLRRC